MAKTGKLTKLKSAIKRWPSFTKQLARTTSSIAAANDVESSPDDQYDSRAVISKQLHAVYVGKSRREYMVSSDVVEHPIIQELVDKSCEEEEGVVVVACEVVLFEHLLWMLENSETQLGSMDELVEFYTC